MNAITALLLIVRDLCRLRGGPQDLPFAPRLLAGLLVVTVAMELIVGQAVGLPGNLLPRSLFSMALLLAGTYAVLAWQKRAPRFVQTVTALAAVGIVFTLLLLPLMLAMGEPPKAGTQLAPGQLLIGWLILGLLAWKLAVDAHIWRQALEIPLGAAVLLAISWFVVDTLLSRWLFGTPP